MTEKKRKAVILDYTALATYDNITPISICLTQREVAILKALLVTAYWSRRWTNLEVSQDVLESQISDLDGKLDLVCWVAEMIAFRDNPVDPCEVQYSVDGGENWLTMFRKDVCVQSSLSSLTEINNAKTEIVNNNITYDGDIINIAPSWEFDEEATDKALCWVVGIFIDLLCDTAIAQIESDNDERRAENDIWSDVVSLFTAAVIAASTAITVNPIVAGAVSWAVTEIAEAIWDDLVTQTTEPFEDEEARDWMKCEIFKAIRGQTVQFYPWQHACDLIEPLTHNAEMIWEQCYIWMQDEDIYVNFLFALEDINSIAESLPPCDCPERWSHTWNFETHGEDTWIVDGDGTYTVDVGYESVIVESVPPKFNMQVLWIKFPELIPRCDKITITYDAVRGTFDANVDALWVAMPDDLNIIQNQGVISTGHHVKNWTADYGPKTECTVGLRSAHCDNENYGSIIIRKVMLEGEGIDPFKNRDTG